MKLKAFLWASSLLQLTAARPAANPCAPPDKEPSSTYKASSVTFATYSGLPSGEPISPESIATLLPGVFWDQDLGDINNLAPESKCKLFYAQHDDATKPGQIAQAEYKMKYPTVALEHSDYIRSVRCSKPDHMDITFKDRRTYLWAKKRWIRYNSETDRTMVFVGKFEGCNPTKNDGMRSWSLVDDVTFNDETLDVDATIIYKEMKDVVDMATIKLGNYSPTPLPPTAAPTLQGQSTPDYGRWGPDFDIRLDDKIGYTNPSMPKITPAPPFRNVTRSDNYKRWGFNPWENITSAFKLIASEIVAIASDASSVLAVATSAIESGAKAVATDAASVVNDFTSYTHHFDIPKFDIKVDINEGTTPFRGLPGRMVVDNVGGVTLYCVDCGAQGSAQFSAVVTFSLLRGIEAGSIDFAGNLKAKVSVGIVNTNRNIQIPWPASATYQVFNVGLPSLSIPNVLTVGPYIALDISGTVSVGATGLIRAGFELEIEKPRFHANIKDLSKSTATGWEPKFKPIFDLDGNVTISAELQTPISLNFGIDVLKGRFQTALSLSEAPSVKFSASNSFNGSANPAFLHNPDTPLLAGGFNPEIGDCRGTMLGLRVGLDTFFGIKGTAVSYPILKLDVYKNEWCLKHNLWSLLTPSTRRATIDGPSSGYASGRIDGAIRDLSIVSGNNGNIYVDSSAMPEGSNGNDTSYQWLYWNNLVVGSQDGRMIYAYADELKSFGVSRFRLAPWDHVPKTAEQVVLVPGDNFMTAYKVGDKGQNLYPIACTYRTQPTKMFLVADLLEGMKKLQDPELQDSITGGEVKACGFLKWKSTALQTFTFVGGGEN
ncbi:hypothetical protein DRE_01204 [Drechslerella stenobrocha 248]|uniref:Peptidase A1 domain-containing protein n=1 Tax=Drechslerella stenobrocha 248 TaxID=1043628 RepID=W7HWQ4_9PEZI|nr:hypothetical protein DRE_01204 [Drechslerella stenobrocha 248]